MSTERLHKLLTDGWDEHTRQYLELRRYLDQLKRNPQHVQDNEALLAELDTWVEAFNREGDALIGEAMRLSGIAH
jgi:hypothetical protein